MEIFGLFIGSVILARLMHLVYLEYSEQKFIDGLLTKLEELDNKSKYMPSHWPTVTFILDEIREELEEQS